MDCIAAKMIGFWFCCKQISAQKSTQMKRILEIWDIETQRKWGKESSQPINIQFFFGFVLVKNKIAQCIKSQKQQSARRNAHGKNLLTHEKKIET